MLGSSFLFGQQDVHLPGIVVEQNSKFNTGTINYLFNTQIKAPNANPQLSDANGKFTLLFPDKPFGNLTRIYASKNGFEVVNEEELKKAAVLGRNAPLKVVLCREGQLYENQVAYYKIAKDAVFISYQERIKILEKKGKESELLMAQLQVDFNKEINTVSQAKKLLEEQLTSAQLEARELADKWVTVNLDDQSDRYQRAFRAFLVKDIDLAIMILDSVDLAQRLEDNSKDTLKIDSNISELQGTKAKKKEQIQQDINQAVFKARLYILHYEFSKAEEFFELALKHDQKNEDLIFEYGYYLQKQNQFKKAIDRYNEVLTLYRDLAKKKPDIYLYNIASTLNNLGMLLIDINEIEGAKDHYIEALKIFRTLAEKDSDKYLHNVANSLNNLGTLLGTINEIEGAKVQLKKALKIYRTLAEKNPDIYLPSIASTLDNLGVLLSDNNEIEEAKEHYYKALRIKRTLAKKNPNLYMPDVAFTLNNLGVLLRAMNEMKGAKDHYNEALNIYRRLSEKNPVIYLPKIASILSNLGVLLSDSNEMREAEVHFNESLKIRITLAEKNPDAYLPDVASTMNNLGVILKDNNKIEEAKTYYKKALEIRRTLAEKNPAIYLPDVSMTLSNLGVLYWTINEMREAKIHFDEALKIERSLSEKKPGKYLVDVASTLNNLGVLLSDNNEIVEAKVHYYEALRIRRILAEQNSDVYNLDVSQTLINIGLLYKYLLKIERDLELKKEGLTLMKEARNCLLIYPQNHPTVQNYYESINRLELFFSNFDQQAILYYKMIDSIKVLYSSIEKESDYREKHSIQEKIIFHISKLNKGGSKSAEISHLLARAYGILAWNKLFIKDFTGAEDAARIGLELDSTEEWINANIAHALLYQGKWNLAKEIYSQLKEDPYGKGTYAAAFLEDLDILEKEGITHPDVKKARKLLE